MRGELGYILRLVHQKSLVVDSCMMLLLRKRNARWKEGRKEGLKTHNVNEQNVAAEKTESANSFSFQE